MTKTINTQLEDDIPYSDLPRWVHYREITSAFAYWAIRLIHGDQPCFPSQLEGVIGFLTAMIRPRFDSMGLARLPASDIDALIRNALEPEEMFQAWGEHIRIDVLIRYTCRSVESDIHLS